MLRLSALAGSRLSGPRKHSSELLTDLSLYLRKGSSVPTTLGIRPCQLEPRDRLVTVASQAPYGSNTVVQTTPETLELQQLLVRVGLATPFPSNLCFES